MTEDEARAVLTNDGHERKCPFVSRASGRDCTCGFLTRYATARKVLHLSPSRNGLWVKE